MRGRLLCGVTSVVMALFVTTTSARAVAGVIVNPTVTEGAGANGTWDYDITLNPNGLAVSSIYIPLLADPTALIYGAPSASVDGVFSFPTSVDGWEYDGTYGAYSHDGVDLTPQFAAPPYFMVFTLDTPTDQEFSINFDSASAPVNGPYQANYDGGSQVIDPPTPIPEPGSVAVVLLLAAGLSLVVRRFRR